MLFDYYLFVVESVAQPPALATKLASGSSTQDIMRYRSVLATEFPPVMAEGTCILWQCVIVVGAARFEVNCFTL